MQDGAGRIERLKAAANALEAKASTWPLWRRLLVFTPIFLALAWLLNFAIMSGLALIVFHVHKG